MTDEDVINLYTLVIEKEIRYLQGYRIYADESMNLRKVRICLENKRDLRYKFFTIGGLIVPENLKLEKIKEMFSEQDYFPDDVKYNFFSHHKTDFKQALKSTRLQRYLQFLLDNDIYIHLHVVNYWYWGIVDFVDSLIEFDVNNNELQKMAVYEGLMAYYDEMTALFIEYNYPAIPIGNEKAFVEQIIMILKKAQSEVFHDGDEVYEPLCQVIELLIQKIA